MRRILLSVGMPFALLVSMSGGLLFSRASAVSFHPVVIMTAHHTTRASHHKHRHMRSHGSHRKPSCSSRYRAGKKQATRPGTCPVPHRKKKA